MTMRTNEAWNPQKKKKKGIDAEGSVKEMGPKLMVLVGYRAG